MNTQMIPVMSTGVPAQNVMTGNIMSVGGGVGDNAVDVTYSTKPQTPAIPMTTGVTTFNNQYTTFSQGSNSVQSYQGGNVMGVGGGIGDNAVDVTYSTKTDNINALGGTTYKTASTSSNGIIGLGQTTQTTNITTTGNLMGVGGGVGDNAVDVTYSTKPNNITALGGTTYTTTSTASNGIIGLGQTTQTTSTTTGNIMGVGGGILDNAVDVTYSTKPDNINVLGTTKVTTTTTTTDIGF